MATKHQSNCYRTIKGEKYINYCDVLCELDEISVAKARELKLRRRLIKHSSGYYQLFIHSDDVKKL